MPKKYKKKLTPEAKKDITKIYEYISFRLCAPQAAIDLCDEIEKAIDRLSSFPFSGSTIGKRYHEFAEYRKYLVRSYNVYYVVMDESVIVLGVMHQNRSYDNLI